MKTNEERTIYLLQEMGECMAVFKRGEWSPDGGPLLLKLSPIYLEHVVQRRFHYQEILLYRICDKYRVNELWFLVGKTTKEKKVSYYPLYGFKPFNMSRVGELARKKAQQWRYMPRSAQTHGSGLVAGFAFCAYVGVMCAVRTWNGVPLATDLPKYLFILCLALIVTIGSLWSIRKEKEKCIIAAQSL